VKLRPTTYAAYSVGCALIWGVVLIIVAAVGSSHTLDRVLLVFLGWALGWLSATIARSAYPRHRPRPRVSARPTQRRTEEQIQGQL
jgi:purine-cytosine permease-like protein